MQISKESLNISLANLLAAVSPSKMSVLLTPHLTIASVIVYIVGGGLTGFLWFACPCSMIFSFVRKRFRVNFRFPYALCDF